VREEQNKSVYFFFRTEKAARAKESSLLFGRVAIEEDEVNVSNFGALAPMLRLSERRTK